MGHRDPQDLLTLGPPGTSGSQDLWEITSTILNLEYQHPGTLKLKHKQRTSLNYIIGHSKRKIACTFSGYLIYRDFIYLTMVIRGQAPLLLPSSYVTVIT